MRKALKLSVLAMLTGALIAGQSFAAGAGSAKPGPSIQKQNQRSHLTTRILRNRSIVSGDVGKFVLPGGFVALHPRLRLDCIPAAGATECNYQADLLVQVLNSIDNNRYGICFILDGTFADPCPVLGLLPNNGDYFSDTTIAFAFSVPPGVHRVGTRFFSSSGVDQIRNIRLVYQSIVQ